MPCPRCFRSLRPLAALTLALGALSVPGFFASAWADEPTSQPAGYSATGYLNFDFPIKFPETLVLHDFDQYMATQAFIIQNNYVLGELAVDPEVLKTRWYFEAKKHREKLEDQLRKILTVHRVPNTTIMEVTMTLPDRYEARLLTNKLMEKYMLKTTQFSSHEYLEIIEALTGEYARLDRQASEKRTVMEKVEEEMIKLDETSTDQALHFWQEEYLKQQRSVMELEASATSTQTSQPAGNETARSERLVAAQKLLAQLKDKFVAATSAKRECQTLRMKYEELHENYRVVKELVDEVAKSLTKLQMDRRDPSLRRSELMYPAE